MLTLISGVLLQIIIARYCGAEAAGIAASAMAVGVFVANITDAGFDLSLPRTVASEYASEYASVSSHLPHLALLIADVQRSKHVVWLCCSLCAVSTLFWRTVADSSVSAHDAHNIDSRAFWQNILHHELPWLLSFAWALQRSAVFTYTGVLRGLQRISLLAKVENSITIGTLLLSFVVVLLPQLVNADRSAPFVHNIAVVSNQAHFAAAVPVIGVLTIQVLGEWLKAIILNRSLRRYTKTIVRARATWSFLWNRDDAVRTRVMLRSIHLSLLANQALSTAEARAGIYLLHMLSTQAAVGYYAAALRFTTALRTVPGALFNHLLPMFSTHSNNEHTTNLRYLWKLSIVCVLGGSMVSVILSLAAEPLMIWVYGASFLPSAPLLQALSWLFALHLINVVLEAYLLAYHQEWAVNLALALGLAIIAGWTIVFLPTHGLYAAALGAVLGQIVMCCVLVGTIFRHHLKSIETQRPVSSTVPEVSAIKPTTQE